MTSFRIFLATIAMSIALSPITSHAQAPAEKAQATIDKGLAYLKAQQKPDSSWQNEGEPPAFTAIVLKAFMGDAKHDAEMPFLEKGFENLLKNQKEDGGIYKDSAA